MPLFLPKSKILSLFCNGSRPILKTMIWIRSMSIWSTPISVLTVNYRLAFDAPFPAQIEDLIAVLQWVATHFEDYDLDPKHVYLVNTDLGVDSELPSCVRCPFSCPNRRSYRCFAMGRDPF